MAKADFVTGIVLICLSLYVIIESWQMPRLAHLKVHPLSVPGIVPAFIGTVLLLFGTVLVIRSVRRGGHHLRFSHEGFRRFLSKPGNQHLLLTAMLTIGYAGFLIGSYPIGWRQVFSYLFSLFSLNGSEDEHSSVEEMLNLGGYYCCRIFSRQLRWSLSASSS